MRGHYDCTKIVISGYGFWFHLPYKILRLTLSAIDPKTNRASKTSPATQENQLLQWGSSFDLSLFLEDLNTRLLQLKAISSRLTHLATDRRHPHREISLCIRQLLPNLGFNGYRDNPSIAIKLKGLPAILECLGLGEFIDFNGEF